MLYFGGKTMRKVLLLTLVMILVVSVSCSAAYADENTYETLKVGSYGTPVKDLQQRLADLNYLERSGVDGSYGNGTAKAVSSFQAAAGLEETGIADETTQKALYSDDAPTLADSILSKRLHDMSDVAGKQQYDFDAIVQGGKYVFTVTPYWGKLAFPDDHGVKCFVPDGAMWRELPYDSHFKPVIDLVEEKAKDEDEHEWRCIAVEIATHDAPGYSYKNSITDYYDSELWDKSYMNESLNGMGGVDIHKVIWNGKEQNVYGVSTGKSDGAKHIFTAIQLYYVPVGYDGVVYLLDNYNANFLRSDQYPSGRNIFNYVTDNTLFFRMK